MTINYLNITATIIRDEALRAAKSGDTATAWRIHRALSTLTEYCYAANFNDIVDDETFDNIRDMYLDCGNDIEDAWRESEECEKLKKWLADPANRSDINYSDIHKDVYGYRPRR